jgi:hypothetical protein
MTKGSVITAVTVTAVGVLTAMIVGLAAVAPMMGAGALGVAKGSLVGAFVLAGLDFEAGFLALSQTAVPRAKAKTMLEIAMSFFI